jgi:hypothetical protein
VFNRGPLPVQCFDPGGSFVTGWGSGEFSLPHAISIDRDDNLWLVDLKHVVEKRSPNGELLMTLGTRGRSAPPHSGEPFNRPTDVAIHPRTGEVFVTDGYRNSAVHRYSPDGGLLQSWGSPGSDPGQFSLPHGVCFLDDDHVVIVDRENFRLQVFTLDGHLEDIWHAYYPQAIRASRLPDGTACVMVGEGPPVAYQRSTPNLGCRIRVLDGEGKEVARLGVGNWGFEPDRFTAIHGIAVDSVGNVYVAEAPFATIVHYYHEDAPPGELLSLRKWRLSD